MIACDDALDFVRNTYRHAKSMLVLGAGKKLLDAAGVTACLGTAAASQGVVKADAAAFAQATPRFIEAVAAHRHFAREADKPVV